LNDGLLAARASVVTLFLHPGERFDQGNDVGM